MIQERLQEWYHNDKNSSGIGNGKIINWKKIRGNFDRRNCEFETGNGILKMETVNWNSQMGNWTGIEIEKRKMRNGKSGMWK